MKLSWNTSNTIRCVTRHQYCGKLGTCFSLQVMERNRPQFDSLFRYINCLGFFHYKLLVVWLSLEMPYILFYLLSGIARASGELSADDVQSHRPVHRAHDSAGKAPPSQLLCCWVGRAFSCAETWPKKDMWGECSTIVLESWFTQPCKMPWAESIPSQFWKTILVQYQRTHDYKTIMSANGIQDYVQG